MQTLPQQFSQVCQRYANKVAVIEARQETDFAQLQQAAQSVAAFLAPVIEAGDRVALLQDNSAEYVASCYGVWLAGGVVVALNTAQNAEDIDNLLRHSESQLLIANAANRNFKQWAAMPERLDLRLLVIGEQGSLASDCWSEVVALESKPPEFDPGLDSLAAIIYTSGTTGNPKGVCLTHRNLAANIASIRDYLAISDSDKACCVLPFFYSFGNSILHSHLLSGSSLLLENSFMYPHKVLENMQAQRVTCFYGVPSTYNLLLARAKLSDYELNSIRYFAQAGGPLAADKVREFQQVATASEFVVMYGQTEASARLSYLPAERLAEKYGAVGIGIPGVALRVVDEQGRDLAAGEQGEVCASGDNIMQGYWRDDAETSKVLVDGWLYTGDLGYLDDEGYLYLVGRKKEMIKTGGHRISPREIEELIATLPEVEDVAVVGVADDILGQAIKVCLIANSDDESDLKRNIMRTCKQKLASYKLPKIIELKDEFPKTASGKIKKHLL